MAKTVKEKSCGLVVFRKTDSGSDYLLLHYPNGHWDFPKGHVEPNETEEETALREMEEETGISDVKIYDGFRDSIEYTFYHNNCLIVKTVIFFCASTTQQEVEISHEHQDHVWLPYDEALAKLTFENAKNILVKSYNFLQTNH